MSAMLNCNNGGTSAAAIKRGTTPTLQIYLDGVDMADVSKVDFLFKEIQSEIKKPIIQKTVVSPESNTVQVDFTLEDTYAMCTAELWMDTRITLKDGKIPPTEMVKINVRKTLFPQEKEG